MKDSLNKKYNFVSKFVTLEDQEDSVNYDEITTVAPPPIGRKYNLSLKLGKYGNLAELGNFSCFSFSFDPTKREKQFNHKKVKCLKVTFIK